jgi:hypothetical protein
LVGLTAKATRDWLDPRVPVLDYANAMVPARQDSASSFQASWQEHVDGKPQYSPSIPPLAPAKFTGSLWLVGRKTLPECTSFGSSLQKSTGPYVQGVVPNAQGPGASNGMLGFMFWAAECEGTRASAPRRRTRVRAASAPERRRTACRFRCRRSGSSDRQGPS